jgi:hypothetical protein
VVYHLMDIAICQTSSRKEPKQFRSLPPYLLPRSIISDVLTDFLTDLSISSLEPGYLNIDTTVHNGTGYLQDADYAFSASWLCHEHLL